MKKEEKLIHDLEKVRKRIQKEKESEEKKQVTLPVVRKDRSSEKKSLLDEVIEARALAEHENDRNRVIKAEKGTSLNPMTNDSTDYVPSVPKIYPPYRINGEARCYNKGTNQVYEGVSLNQAAQLGLDTIPNFQFGKHHGVLTEPNNQKLDSTMLNNGFKGYVQYTTDGPRIHLGCDQSVDRNYVPIYVGTGTYWNEEMSKDMFGESTVERNFMVYYVHKNYRDLLQLGVTYNSDNGSLILSNGKEIPKHPTLVTSSLEDLLSKGVNTVYYRNTENPDGNIVLNPIYLAKFVKKKNK